MKNEKEPWVDPLHIPIDEYEAELKARSTYGNGTRANPVDWIDHRQVECLSQGEKMVYMYLRWDDEVKEIRTQVRMNMDIVKEIVNKYKFPYPGNNLTTDFLVTYKDDTHRAFSVKNSEDDISEQNDPDGRIVRRQIIEAVYWEMQNIPWRLILKSNLDRTFINNIRIVTRFYDLSSVWDQKSLIAYLIARKIIKVDMYKPINFPELVKFYFGKEREL